MLDSVRATLSGLEFHSLNHAIASDLEFRREAGHCHASWLIRSTPGRGSVVIRSRALASQALPQKG